MSDVIHFMLGVGVVCFVSQWVGAQRAYRNSNYHRAYEAGFADAMRRMTRNSKQRL